jgi:CrcB protein
MPTRLLLIAAAAAAGALARYGLAGLVQSGLGTRYPWSTLAVNVIGCFVAGGLFGLFETRWMISGEARVAIFIGFLGSFTTFSTYMLETSMLARDSQWVAAIGNVVLQNGVGAAALFLGLIASRTVAGEVLAGAVIPALVAGLTVVPRLLSRIGAAGGAPVAAPAADEAAAPATGTAEGD